MYINQVTLGTLAINLFYVVLDFTILIKIKLK